MKFVRTFVFIGISLLPLMAEAGVDKFAATVAPCPSLPSCVVNDVKIDFTGQYTGAQGMVKLTSGTIYQDSFGDFLPPLPALIATLPSVECDTFVAHGSPVRGGPFDPSISGVQILTDTPTELNWVWNPAGGVTIQNQNDFLIMRLTMSKDAQGTVQFLASAGGTPAVVNWFVRNGVVTAVPEPASAALFGWAIAVALGRRRR